MPRQKISTVKAAAPRLRIDATDIALGARVRVRRLQLKLSLEALGKALGVTYQQIQKYESGKDRISASMLLRLAKQLDCSAASLIGEEPGSVDGEVAPHLAVPGALDLLDLYSRIESSATRRRILDLLQDLAHSAPVPADSAGAAWQAAPAPWRRGIEHNAAPAPAGSPGKSRRKGRTPK